MQYNIIEFFQLLDTIQSWIGTYFPNPSSESSSTTPELLHPIYFTSHSAQGHNYCSFIYLPWETIAVTLQVGSLRPSVVLLVSTRVLKEINWDMSTIENDHISSILKCCYKINFFFEILWKIICCQTGMNLFYYLEFFTLYLIKALFNLHIVQLLLYHFCIY